MYAPKRNHCYRLVNIGVVDMKFYHPWGEGSEHNGHGHMNDDERRQFAKNIAELYWQKVAEEEKTSSASKLENGKSID